MRWPGFLLALRSTTRATAKIFTIVIGAMIFGYFINREHEALDRYVFGGIALSFTGALALTLSAEVVTSIVNVPEWLRPLAEWHWP